MKKKLSILLLVGLVALMAMACNKEEPAEEPTEQPTAEEQVAEPEQEQESVIKSELGNYEAIADAYVQAAEKYYSKVEQSGIDGSASCRKDYKAAKKKYKNAKSALKIDYNSLSDADKAIYDEVNDRVESKIASVKESHADALQMLVEQGLE